MHLRPWAVFLLCPSLSHNGGRRQSSPIHMYSLFLEPVHRQLFHQRAIVAELQTTDSAVELMIDLNARDFFEIDVPNLL